MSEMKTWMFTFGWGQRHAGCTQPIKAENAHAVRLKMMQLYGKEWCWQYSEEEYDKQNLLKDYKLLPPVTVSPQEAQELYMSEEVPA